MVGQFWMPIDNKAFTWSITTNRAFSKKMAEVQDAASFVICGDGGLGTSYFMNVGGAAYPDICRAECFFCSCVTSWEECPDSSSADYSPECDACTDLHATQTEFREPSARRQFTRHLGAVNLGFLDGHAQSIASETLLTRIADGQVTGLQQIGPWSGSPAECYEPPYLY